MLWDLQVHRFPPFFPFCSPARGFANKPLPNRDHLVVDTGFGVAGGQAPLLPRGGRRHQRPGLLAEPLLALRRHGQVSRHLPPHAQPPPPSALSSSSSPRPQQSASSPPAAGADTCVRVCVCEQVDQDLGPRVQEHRRRAPPRRRPPRQQEVAPGPPPPHAPRLCPPRGTEGGRRKGPGKSRCSYGPSTVHRRRAQGEKSGRWRWVVGVGGIVHIFCTMSWPAFPRPRTPPSHPALTPRPVRLCATTRAMALAVCVTAAAGAAGGVPVAVLVGRRQHALLGLHGRRHPRLGRRQRPRLSPPARSRGRPRQPDGPGAKFTALQRWCGPCGPCLVSLGERSPGPPAIERAAMWRRRIGARVLLPRSLRRSVGVTAPVCLNRPSGPC